MCVSVSIFKWTFAHFLCFSSCMINYSHSCSSASPPVFFFVAFSVSQEFCSCVVRFYCPALCGLSLFSSSQLPSLSSYHHVSRKRNWLPALSSSYLLLLFVLVNTRPSSGFAQDDINLSSPSAFRIIKLKGSEGLKPINSVRVCVRLVCY